MCFVCFRASWKKETSQEIVKIKCSLLQFSESPEHNGVYQYLYTWKQIGQKCSLVPSSPFGKAKAGRTLLS